MGQDPLGPTELTFWGSNKYIYVYIVMTVVVNGKNYLILECPELTLYLI